MKKKSDPRHKKRAELMQDLFSWQFKTDRKPTIKIRPVVSNLSDIDELISKSAPDRPISEINRIDLAILRLAVFELIIEKGVPPKVVIDEAVELGKEYGSDSSAAFINGALGKLIQLEKIKTD
ncbi:MAG: Transcription antitermination factor NusB [uncultured bacterium]|nr:MAG: Transcription antitermination factor NusB [uncultured bacterium]OGE21042.1 MAG: transcription antitermination factor NusB [Candidatus Daviesbacteria bacterium RIFCSPHIGHO2_01_FULL_40_24]OGE29162.1 MAG: transcription antitermination factor NusB [Candidatus Daviesbacteria bacterium RIFCSPHIGHO2_02_FULL_40_16]OGE43117.1 MAG: transcription antitermination factor NusB [Candidatus Daviesbacteria bacterium RIFCSPLOWO2_01_FULL_39_23]OGE67459.1 MAG: transcription antitermination factor NusB [Can